ncbi:MAG TPA: RDD family protein, partial [Candidatus Lokiarchaeia archaeon]|nr:RDD family protein [Candidatus Lokiarchaeia archaeon]
APLEVGVSQEESESLTRPEHRTVGMQGMPQGMQWGPQGTQGMPVGRQGSEEPGEQTHLRLRVADVGPRVLAYVIDVVILELLLLVLGYIPIFQFNTFYGTEADLINAISSGDPNAILALVNWSQFALSYLFDWSIYFIYFGILESYKGRTLGKAILSLRSVKERDGQPISSREGLLNSIAKSFGLSFYFIPLIIDVILGAATQKNRTLRQIRLGQRLSGEVVIKVTR